MRWRAFCGGWARRVVRHAAILLAVYAGVVLSYTAYNLIRFNEFIIGAQGITSFVYMGARGWSGPEEMDQQLLKMCRSTPRRSHA